MSTLATLTNHQVRLASRPVGLPTRANWSFTQEPVAEPPDGGMKSKEDVVKGLDTFPETLLKLFNGENFGKLVLQVGDE